jgi:hypothetical protein
VAATHTYRLDSTTRVRILLGSYYTRAASYASLTPIPIKLKLATAVIIGEQRGYMDGTDGRRNANDPSRRHGLARSFNLYTTVYSTMICTSCCAKRKKGVSEAHLIFVLMYICIHSCRSCLHMALHTTGRRAPTAYIHLASGFRL